MKNQPEWWDPYSCQPYKLKDESKPRSRWSNVWDYAKTGLTALLGLPLIVISYLLLRAKPSSKDPKEFIGLSIDLGFGYESEMVDMVNELGVENLLLRIPSWDADDLDSYTDFLSELEGKDIVINILQSPHSTQDYELWQSQVRKIIGVTSGFTNHYWIGNAINRTKWGCRHSGEALQLQEKVEELRSEFHSLFILGSSVIDFEPLLTWRSLCNFAKFKLEATAALMYVNRRHSPYGTQYGIFDLKNKLRLTKAMIRLSNRSKNKLWITETNWPLLNTKPYTPNSGNPTRTVDEATQAEYLKLYYQIAYQSGWVERVYWWQLINPGYGLVDHRDGSLRKLPSYTAFKQLLDGELVQKPKEPN